MTTTHELPDLTPEQISRRAELLGHVLGPWQASATGYPVRRCPLCRERVQAYSLDPTVRHAGPDGAARLDRPCPYNALHWLCPTPIEPGG